jgi:hypothetical protein
MASMVRKSVYETAADPMPMYGAGVGNDPVVDVRASTRQAPTPLHDAFFGRANLDRIKMALRDSIRDQLGYVIDWRSQSDQDLLVIMRYVYVQHGANVGGAAEIRRLNDLVLREIVPQVASGVLQHLSYLRDASQLPVPLDRGIASSVKGTLTTELFKGF